MNGTGTGAICGWQAGCLEERPATDYKAVIDIFKFEQRLVFGLQVMSIESVINERTDRLFSR